MMNKNLLDKDVVCINIPRILKVYQLTNLFDATEKTFFDATETGVLTNLFLNIQIYTLNIIKRILNT